MKKIISILVISLMTLITFTGCQNSSSGTSSSKDSSATGAKTSSSAEKDHSYTNRDLDSSYDETTATKITLKDGASSAEGEGASVKGDDITITKEGTYILSGTLTNGQVTVDTSKQEKVQLVLAGAEIKSADDAPLYIKQTDKVFITLAEGTDNSLEDGSTYNKTAQTNKVDAALFSKEDLTINGTGKLTVKGNYRNGIVSKDDLAITAGTITVTAANDGLQGKDAVKIKDGTVTITAECDGIQSDNTESGSGYVGINGGTLKITTGGGSKNASTKDSWGGWGPGGGQQGSDISSSEDTVSAKAIKGANKIYINGGTVTIDSSDDSIHSNGDLEMAGGTVTAASGDDGIHGDGDVAVSGGMLKITKSYEGIEGKTVTISGGKSNVTASDDGLNAAGGNDGSSTGDRKGANQFAADSSTYIKITGGTLNLDASGDGIDSNGSLDVTGGTVYVSGSTGRGNGGMDYNGEAKITGGTVLIAGSTGMAQNFGDSSSQCSLMYNMDTAVKGGTKATLKDSSGKELASFTPAKDYQNVVVSTPTMKKGTKVTLYAGSTKVGTVTLSSVSTTEGKAGDQGGSEGRGKIGHGGGGHRDFKGGAGDDSRGDSNGSSL